MPDDEPRVCPHAETCAMYDMFRKSGTLGVWQLSYCKAEFHTCARYEESSRGRRVPLTLLPNGKSLGK